MKPKTALLFGATGLVGSQLLDLLAANENYDRIKVYGRQATGNKHPKVQEHIIDFDHLEDYAHLMTGDRLFICLGTTIRKAGSVARMEQIDRDYPAKAATMARSNGVSRIAVVSSMGADARSGNYYLRIKGEMEQAILAAGFPRTVIVRPSILYGKRGEFRFGEWVGKGVMKALGLLMQGPLKKYRGIPAKTVARAMIRLIDEDSGETTYRNDQLFR
ncbi:MAG: NAD(P)H-binding protein [Bacteroidales bacterium]